MKSRERVALWGVVLGGFGMAAAAFLSSPASLVPQASAGSFVVQADSKIALCDMFNLTRRMFESEAYSKPRDKFRDDEKAKLEPLQKELEAMGKKFQELKEGDPEREKIMTEGQAKQQAMQTMSQTAGEKLNKFQTEQVLECYKKVRESALSVAAKEGFNIVLSGKANELTDLKQLQDLLFEIVQRPVVQGGTDITEKVIADLKLPPEPVAAPAVPEGQGPAAPPPTNSDAPAGQPK